MSHIAVRRGPARLGKQVKSASCRGPAVWGLVVLAALMSGCSGYWATMDLRNIAARDFNCPKSELVIAEGDGTATVSGCGLSLAYDLSCRSTTVSRSARYVQGVGGYQQQCGYSGFGKFRTYGCRSVWTPSKWTVVPGGLEVQKTCRWVARGGHRPGDAEDRVRRAEASSRPARGQGWESGRRASSSTPGTLDVLAPTPPAGR